MDTRLIRMFIWLLVVSVSMAGCATQSLFVKNVKNNPGIPIATLNVIVDTETSTRTREFEKYVKQGLSESFDRYGIATRYVDNQSVALESRPLVQIGHAFLKEGASHVLFIDLKDIDTGIYTYDVQLMAWDKSRLEERLRDEEASKGDSGMATVYRSIVVAAPHGISGTWQNISQEFADRLVADLESSGVLPAATVQHK